LEWICQPVGMLPILSAARSAPVSTASTPGALRAASARIALIRACAWGERMMWAQAWSGRVMSSVYVPAPVRKRRSSFRFTDAPIPSLAMAISPRPWPPPARP